MEYTVYTVENKRSVTDDNGEIWLKYRTFYPFTLLVTKGVCTFDSQMSQL